MKKSIALILLLLSCSLIVQAQSTETRNLESFSRIHVAEGIEATLVPGNKESIDISVQGNISTQEVLTEMRGSKLRIHLEDGRRYRRVKVKVNVTYRSLTAIIASSAARIKVKGNLDNMQEISVSSAGSIYAEGTIKGSDMELDASSAGGFEGKVQATNIRVRVSSSGGIRLSGGSTGSLLAKGSSSGRLRGYDFTCESADVRVSSGASIRLNVAKAIEARASSGGSVVYTGSPQKVRVSSSSGGSIRKR